MRKVKKISRRDFLKGSLATMALLVLPINAQAREIKEEQPLQTEQPQQLNNSFTYQDAVNSISNEDEFVYRFRGKNGRDSIFYSIYKYPDRATLNLSRTRSSGFLRNIDYGIRLTDRLETGWGNIDRATITFKDGRERNKRESSKASFDLSELSQDEEIIKQMQEVYTIIGHGYLTRKRSLFNEDINIVDRLFAKIFEDYRISPAPLMKEHRIPSKRDFQNQENNEDTKNQSSYDGKTLIYQGIQAGTKIGIPR